MSLIEVDGSNAYKYDFPAGLTGLWVQSVDPLSAAHDGGIDRGTGQQPASGKTSGRTSRHEAPPHEDQLARSS